MTHLRPYTVVIPTCRTDDTIAYTLGAVAKQIVLPSQVIIVVDIDFAGPEGCDAYQMRCQDYVQQTLPLQFITQYNSDFTPGRHNASYVRNTGIAHVQTELILLIDDDNDFTHDFMQQLLTQYEEMALQTATTSSDVLLIPTEHYHHTGRIRHQGYQRFHYRLGRVVPYRMAPKQPHAPMTFAASNCLFGATQLFVTHPFDEDIPFVYEDFDVTMRISQAGNPCYVFAKPIVHHMMRPKTALKDSYLSSTALAYQKGKNRVIWIQKTANLRQCLQYFTLGICIHTLALVYKICCHAPTRGQRCKLIAALCKGTWAGLTHRQRPTQKHSPQAL